MKLFGNPIPTETHLPLPSTADIFCSYSQLPALSTDRIGNVGRLRIWTTCEGVKETHLKQNGAQWRAFVNTVMYLLVQ
jgi:hypothetical protein